MTHERHKLSGAPLRASEKRNIARGPTAPSLRAQARTHALEALEALASLAKGAASESVRVSAANALLDRAYGKPASGAAKALQAKDDGDDEGVEVEWLPAGRS